MATKAFQPAPVKIIEDLDSIKAISDPLRVQILEALSTKPRSINQVAERLGLAAGRLYYHFNILEKHGFIDVVETKTRGNILEKFYWVTAFDFRLDEAACQIAGPSHPRDAVSMLLQPLDVTRQDIIRSMEARSLALEQGEPKHPRNVKQYREVRCIPDDRAQEFLEKLNELTAEFETLEHEDESEAAVNWALTLLFYPSFYYPKEEDRA
jgi:DNA-binding transcriptional ArsR family regulator